MDRKRGDTDRSIEREEIQRHSVKEKTYRLSEIVDL